MPRLARVIVPDVPHYVTQRGARRAPIFSEPADYALYRDLMAERLRHHGVKCSAYCLTPEQVHLLLTPVGPQAMLSRAVGEAHRRYTAFINVRARTTGHLFQGRFGCVAMDEAHWLNAVRYLAFYPTRAGLAARPQDWRWSSVRAHIEAQDDALVDVSLVLSAAPRFADLIDAENLRDAPAFEGLGSNGRPLGDAAFLAKVEARIGRSLARGRPGPKPRPREPA